MTQTLNRHGLLVSLLILASLWLTSCRSDLPDVPGNEFFTKEKLEKLGGLLRQKMLSQYEFLPELAPYDTAVYWYVQTLYTQATHSLHLDRQSPVYDRWQQDRDWKVFIINDDSIRHVFALPGGDLFISTGLLKSLHQEYELYALLSYEACLMNEGHLLDRLILSYNSLVIRDMIEENTDVDGLAEALPHLAYDEKTVEDVDEESLENTCATSILDPTGIAGLMTGDALEGSAWLASRPSYAGRASKITGLPGHTCGHLKSNGGYQRYVLNVL